MIIDKPRRVLTTGLAALALSLAGTAHATLIGDEVTFEYTDNGATETRTITVAEEFDLGPFAIDFEIEGGNGVIDIAGDFRIFGNEALRVLDLDWTDEASRLAGIEVEVEDGFDEDDLMNAITILGDDSFEIDFAGLGTDGAFEFELTLRREIVGNGNNGSAPPPVPNPAPVPEPGSLLLLGLGLIALGALRRRRHPPLA